MPVLSGHGARSTRGGEADEVDGVLKLPAAHRFAVDREVAKEAVAVAGDDHVASWSEVEAVGHEGQFLDPEEFP